MKRCELTAFNLLFHISNGYATCSTFQPKYNLEIDILVSKIINLGPKWGLLLDCNVHNLKRFFSNFSTEHALNGEHNV